MKSAFKSLSEKIVSILSI